MKTSLDKYLQPKGKKNYLGIEIEFSCPIPEEALIEALCNAKLQKYCELGRDADPEPSHESYELKVLVDEDNAYKILSRIGRLLDGIGATTNDSCGLHVHLDMRNREASKAYKNLYQCQNLLFNIAHKGRSYSSMCNKMTTDKLEEVRDSHYNAISPRLREDKNTIEVRIREGIVDSDDIYNWCSLLSQIVNHKQINKDIEDADDLVHLQLKEDTVKYVKSFFKRSSKRRAA